MVYDGENQDILYLWSGGRHQTWRHHGGDTKIQEELRLLEVFMGTIRGNYLALIIGKEQGIGDRG